MSEHTLSETPARGVNRLLLMGLALLVVLAGIAYGFLLTNNFSLIFLLFFPLAGLTAILGLWQPELLIITLLGITWGYVSEVLVKFYGMPSLAKSLVALLVALVLYRRFLGRREPLANHPLLWWMGGYFLIICAGLWYAPDPDRTWLVVIDFAKELLLFFVVINMITTERWLERGVWAMLLVGMVLGAMTLYQEITNNYANDFNGFARSSVGQIAEGVSNRARAGGPTSEPNAFGQQMIVLVPIGIWASLSARTVVNKVLGGFAAFACLAGAALSFSRGTYLAIIVLVVLMGLQLRLNWRYLLVLPLLIFALLSAPPELRARFGTLQSLLPGGERIAGEQDASVERRSIEMEMAFNMFIDHPVIGVGADNYVALFDEYITAYGSDVDASTRNAHSYYLEIAAEHGLLGIIAVGGIFLLTLKALAQARRDFESVGNHRMAGLASAMRIGFLVYSVTAIFLHGDYSRFLWLQVDLAAACALTAHRLAAIGIPTSDVLAEAAPDRDAPLAI
jgi:putative inorganic carbon (HCO3(-)) transporter